MKIRNVRNNIDNNKDSSILLGDGHFLFRLKKENTSPTCSYFDTKNKNGITLIALIITIILMLILASVVINLTIGENGIFDIAKEAKKQTTIAEYKEKVELSRAQVATCNLGEVTLDNLIEQIYKDKIVPNGNITKSQDGQSAKMITKEGCVYIITKDIIEYIGNENVKPTKKEANIEIKEIKEGKLTLKIKAAAPNENIQKIAIYDKTNSVVKTMNYTIELEQIEREETLYLPFYEEQSYYAKITNSESEITTETVTPEENTNYIATAKDLKKLSDLVEAGEKFTGQTIKQVESINLSSICSTTLGTWKPIGHAGGVASWFNGSYDGNNKEITKLYIDNTEDITVGLFGFLGYNGKVSNLTVTGKVTTATDRLTGGIVGRNEGIIENCINNVDVTNKLDSAGGIAGGNLNTITNCVNNANITAINGSVGGITQAQSTRESIVSQNNVTATRIVINCKNSKDAIITGNAQVGGICGQQSIGTIENCINEGTVIANNSMSGGIIGYSEANIINCKNKGRVSSNSNPSDWQNQGTGGIVGKTTSNVSCSSNEGDISSEGYYVGGIVGYGSENTIISKCYNIGSLEAKQNAVGGIVGIHAKEISNCYNYLGNDKVIKANHNVGGIIGNTNVEAAVIKNCYNIGENIITTGGYNSNAAIVGGNYVSGCSIDKCYYVSNSSLNGIGNESSGDLIANNIVAKDLNKFKLDGTNIGSVTYLLNENGTKEIWKQNNDINDGYPYLEENKPE